MKNLDKERELIFESLKYLLKGYDTYKAINLLKEIEELLKSKRSEE